MRNMTDVTDFAFLTLNTTSMYRQSSSSEAFSRLAEKFKDYLLTKNERILAQWVSDFIPPYKSNNAAAISQELQNLSVGQFKFLRSEESGGRTVIYKFKKEEDSLVLSMYRFQTTQDRYLDDIFKNEMTELLSIDNTAVNTYTFTLEQARMGNELAHFLKIACSFSDHNFGRHLKSSLAFLKAKITIQPEQYSLPLLQGQTLFIRSVYRLLEDCVSSADKLKLEQHLLGFVRENIFANESIATDYPELYKDAIINHIAYFQFTNCEEDTSKRYYTLRLQAQLAHLPRRSYQVVNKEKLRLTALSSYNNPFEIAKWRNKGLNAPTKNLIPVLPPITFLGADPITNPLLDAERLCNDLGQAAAGNGVWTLLSIEYFILRCPLPIQEDKSPHPAYKKLSLRDWKALGASLQTIGDYYLHAVESQLGNKQTPKLLVTLCSIILFRAYCQENERGSYSILGLVNILLNDCVSKMVHLPHMSTYHPEFDRRWLSLCALCIPDPGADLGKTATQIYQKLLETSSDYPALQKETDKENTKQIKGNKTALAYYFSSSTIQNKYPDIQSKFNAALPLENFLTRCLKIVMAYNMQYSHNATEYSYGYEINTPLTGFRYDKMCANTISKPGFVTASKENCSPDSLVSKALRRKYLHAVSRNSKPYTSNTIQITPQFGDANRDMTYADIQLRHFLQMGLKDNHIPLVLDFYYSKIQDLSAVDVQYYVQENLLAHALLPYLRQSLFGSYLNYFDAFIEKGLGQFENHAHQLTQTSLSFIQLVLYVNTYIALELREDRDDRLHKLLDRLDEWIKIHHTNHNISASLHQYRLALIITLNQLSLATDAHFEKAFISYSYLKIQSNLEKTSTVVETAEQNGIEYQFQYWSQQVFAKVVTPDLIRRLAEQIDLPIDINDEIQINSNQIGIYRNNQPLYFFDPALSVFVDTEGLVYTSVPSKLRTHPIFSYLNLSPEYCFCNTSQSIVVLAHDPKETRLEFEGESVAVFQSLEVFGRKEKLQLVPLNGLSRTKINFKNSVFSIPISTSSWSGYVFSDHYRCWASFNEKTAYIMADDRVIYTITRHQISYHDPDNPSAILMHYSGNQQLVESFEEPQFCHTHLEPQTFHGHMQLVRYPELRFEIQAGRLYYKYHETRYEQAMHGTALFSQAAEVCHLVFQNPDDTTQQIALLKVHRISLNSTSSNSTSPIFYTQSNRQDAANTTLKSVVYDVDWVSATLIPHNASDALYLAYVYAATYDYDRAIATMNALNLVELQTNQNEITTLSWLMDLKQGDPKRIAACQLKALSLYLRCVKEKYSGKDSGKTSLLALASKINDAYNLYIAHINYLPNTYLLNDLAVDSIENFLQKQTSVCLRAKTIVTRTVSRLSPYVYLHNKDQLPKNLLDSPEGVINPTEAEEKLTSDFDTDHFPKYFAAFIRLTQSHIHKSRVLNFSLGILQHNNFSIHAQILYFLCKQQVNLNSGKLGLDQIKTTDSIDFSFDSVNVSHSTITVPKPSAPVPTSIARLALVPALEPLTAMSELIKTHYADFYVAYQSIDAEYAHATETNMSEQEYGQLKLQYSERKLNLMKATFGTDEIRAQLLEKLEAKRSELDSQLKTYWAEAISIANQALLVNQYYLVQASYYTLLTEQDLMRCYATGAQDMYAALTTLTDEDTIQRLHQTVHNAMSTSLKYQQFQRLIDELTKIQAQGSTIIRWGRLLDLMLREHVPTLNERADMIHLEVAKNIMIRPDQKQMSDGLQTSPRIIDATMGSGKTSVVIPMTVSQIPEKTIFVVIVLRALLKTTHAYLHKVGAQLNQVPYLFDFHRNDDSSPEALMSRQQLFHDLVFNNNPAKPHFLVSTADSVQSLGMKYLEFVYATQYKEYEKQILALEPMLLMLLEYGKALLDEVHEIQDDYKSPVRYALDKPMQISLELVQDVIRLYQFRDEYPTYSMSKFAQRLLDSLESPIQKHLKTCIKANPQSNETVIKQEILRHLLKKSDLHFDLTPRFRRFLETIQTQLRLFEYVNKQVFHKKHYGPSKRKDLTALERCLAIPYFKSEKPKEGSHFENPQEYIVYTIESLLKEFPEELCVEIIEKWIAQAAIEKQNSSDQFHTFEETPTAIRFRDLFGFEFHADILKHKGQVLEVLACIQDSREIRYSILEFDILPTIEIDCTVIESRAFDHLFSYKDGSGLTATPDLANQNLPIDNSASRGDREATADLLIQYQTPVRHLDYSKLDEFVTNLYDNHPNPAQFRAIIDVGGRVRGENKEIARAFARVLQQKDSPIQYVIFYDEADELYAVSTQNIDKIVFLALSTDPDVIGKKLHGCPIDNRAIVLDESHTEGADHVLAIDCDGAVIINIDTTFDKMMQGIKRLRDLAEKQRVTLFLPTSLSSIQTIEGVIDYTKEIARSALPARMLSTASGEILSLIRRDLMTQLLRLPNLTAKHEFLRQPEVQAFFIRSRIESVDLAHNDSDTAMTPRAQSSNRATMRLEAQASKSIKNWHKVSQDPTVESKINMVLGRPMLDMDPSSGDLFQGTLETQTQTQLQTVPPVYGVKYDPSLKEKAIQPWRENNLVPLIDLLPPPAQLGFSFSAKILVSPNFFHVYEKQSNEAINPFMKPVDTLLFTMLSPEDITVCLIANDEAHDPSLLAQIAHSQHPKWLSTTNSLVLEGTAPEGIRDNYCYQELLEQVRFFAGKFNELVEQKSAYIWLPEDTKRKFDFYDAMLKLWREIDLENLEKLKINFSRHMIVFREMSKYPFKNYTEDFAWEDLDPDITDSDIYIFQMLGRSFFRMNRAYYNYDFAGRTSFQLAQDLKHDLRLPAIILGYVVQHFNRLKEYQFALKTLVEPSDIHYLLRLATVTGNIKQRLEEILTVSIPQLLEQYGYRADEQVFPLPELLSQFELDALGGFLASHAFPDGARMPFIQPIQAKLNSLQPAQQVAVFANFSITEHKLRYLLNALNLSAEVLLHLAEKVEDEATMLIIAEKCKGDSAVLKVCLQRFSASRAVLDQVTKTAVAEETFIDLLERAEQQGCLFEEAWLDILFQNSHLPIHLLLPILEKQDINAAFLRHMYQDKRVSAELVKIPLTLISVLNNVSVHESLDTQLKQQVIVTWVNDYAALPSNGDLTRGDHPFYTNLLAAMLTKEGDSALAYVLNDRFIFSNDLYVTLVSSVMRYSVTNYEASKRYMLAGGAVFQVLLANYLTIDSDLLVAILLTESTEDAHLKLLMNSQYLEKNARSFVAKVKAIDWLIDHEKSNATILYWITQDKRFTATHAIQMLTRDLPANVMNAILGCSKTVCTADVYIAILKDATKKAYHARSIAALLDQLPLSAENMLTLIDHLDFSNNDQIEKLVPHCSREEEQKAFVEKATKCELAFTLLKRRGGITASAALAIVNKLTLAHSDVFSAIYQQHFTSQDVCYALRNIGLNQPTVLKFQEFQAILRDHKFMVDSLPQLLETYPANNSKLSMDPAIQSLQKSALELQTKSKAFLNHKKAPYDKAAQAGTELYFCLRHQLMQYENKLITRKELARNLEEVLPRYKAILSQHRGYRQVLYDIAQAILCLLGVGVLMTAYSYATKGTCRLFIWKNEAQRIVEKAEEVIHSPEFYRYGNK